MPEKSADTLHAQHRMVACRKNGNRDMALWWMRVAASYRNLDAARAEPFYDDMEGVWWSPRSTRYVNG